MRPSKRPRVSCLRHLRKLAICGLPLVVLVGCADFRSLSPISEPTLVRGQASDYKVTPTLPPYGPPKATMLPPVTDSQPQSAGQPKEELLPKAKIVFGSNNRGVQARMCAEGGGFAVLPCPLGDATPGLSRIDLGEAPPGRDVWLGYHRDLRRVARLRALLDATIEALGSV